MVRSLPMSIEQRKKIWLVDDNEAFLHCMTSILLARLPGAYTLVSAESAKEVDPQPGDIVVLDQHGCDSDFLAAKPEGVEIIAISGDSDLEGSVDLFKPFSPEDLFQAIFERAEIINQRKTAA